MNPTAKQILESTAFKAASKKVEERAFNEWKRGESTAVREALWQRLKATEALTRELRALAGEPAARKARNHE